MEYPTAASEFIRWFKDHSERHFAELQLDAEAYGLQHQPGTRWRPGLSESELAAFQAAVGFDFPEELRAFFRAMNGTTVPGINVYGECGTPHDFAPIYFSYPEHLPNIQQRIAEILAIKGLTLDQMKEKAIPFIFPINDFYFLIIDRETNPVYFLTPVSPTRRNPQPDVYGSLWTDTLQGWLVKDAFARCTHVNDAAELPNRERTPNYWTSEDEAP
jgi:hypothetical protein